VIAAVALPGVPEVRPGDDLAALLADAAARAGGLEPRDVLCVAHKVVSKAEGRVVRLADVEPGEQARRWGAAWDRDPRQIQVVLDEAAEVVRAEGPGRLICRTRHGFVCANAGVDRSNAGGDDLAILLPVDPDASARRLRAELGCAVVVTDSFGRPWRIGQAEIAVGCAGLVPVDDWRGRSDRDGHELQATMIAVADQAAAAADLARGKDRGEPAVRLRGLGAHVTDDDGPGAAALVRALDQDLFR
jgi:coenzyme F420-0:L-glutamate ligase/coenzyme F420-1:gamma-L-glutamate ligase